MLGSLYHPPFLSPPATLCVAFLITHSLSLILLFMEGTTILLKEDSFFLSPNNLSIVIKPLKKIHCNKVLKLGLQQISGRFGYHFIAQSSHGIPNVQVKLTNALKPSSCQAVRGGAKTTRSWSSQNTHTTFRETKRSQNIKVIRSDSTR